MLSLDRFLGRKERKEGKKVTEIASKTGEIKYKCECGEITTYLRLIETRGKCPKCGRQLVKFSGGS